MVQIIILQKQKGPKNREQAGQTIFDFIFDSIIEFRFSCQTLSLKLKFHIFLMKDVSLPDKRDVCIRMRTEETDTAQET